MRLELATQATRKQAFRAAYDFLETHNEVLAHPDEYAKLAREAAAEYHKHPENLLEMYLLLGICECLFNVSDMVRRNDSKRTTERP